MAGIASDAMRDVTQLAKQLVSIKNRTTGVEISKVGLDNWEYWVNVVRHADQHQEEYDFVYNKKTPSEIAEELAAQDEEDLDEEGNERITLKWLGKQHYMTLQKKAKAMGIDHNGTKADLVDRIHKALP